MSDNAADVLTGDVTLSTTVNVGGETIDIEFEDPTFDQLDGLEDDIDGDVNEFSLANKYIDEFLIDPDVDSGDIPMSKTLAVYRAMAEEIVTESGVNAAIDDMPMDGEGNE